MCYIMRCEAGGVAWARMPDTEWPPSPTERLHGQYARAANQVLGFQRTYHALVTPPDPVGEPGKGAPTLYMAIIIESLLHSVSGHDMAL